MTSSYGVSSTNIDAFIVDSSFNVTKDLEVLIIRNCHIVVVFRIKTISLQLVG